MPILQAEAMIAAGDMVLMPAVRLGHLHAVSGYDEVLQIVVTECGLVLSEGTWVKLASGDQFFWEHSGPCARCVKTLERRSGKEASARGRRKRPHDKGRKRG